jgi:hypothetical protein
MKGIYLAAALATFTGEAQEARRSGLRVLN